MSGHGSRRIGDIGVLRLALRIRGADVVAGFLPLPIEDRHCKVPAQVS